VAFGGGQIVGDSYFTAISGDGRHVAFASQASNLVGGDTNGRYDVFVFDRLVSSIERASVASDGSQSDENSFDSLAISRDGRQVAFSSFAATLVPDDTNGSNDVFVRDRRSFSDTGASLSVGPTNLMGISVDSTSIRLSWGPPSDGRAILSYRIYRWIDSRCSAENCLDPVGTVSGASTSYLDTDLQPSTFYSYSVSAVDSQGPSTESSPVDVGTMAPPDFIAPVAVTRAPTDVTASGVTLNGTADANGSSGSAWFEYGEVGTTTLLSLVSQSVGGVGEANVVGQLDGLPPGTRYRYRLCVQTWGEPVCDVEVPFLTRPPVLADEGNISTVIPATAARVDGYDLIALGAAFGSSPSDKNWNPLADLNGDELVDGRDLTILAVGFGRSQ
jgi:hypothetical protein